MVETRDSKKNAVEIYATEVARLQLPAWREVASAPAKTAVPATTVAGVNLQSIPPVVFIGAGGLLLLMLMRG